MRVPKLHTDGENVIDVSVVVVSEYIDTVAYPYKISDCFEIDFLMFPDFALKFIKLLLIFGFGARTPENI